MTCQITMEMDKSDLFFPCKELDIVLDICLSRKGRFFTSHETKGLVEGYSSTINQ